MKIIADENITLVQEAFSGLGDVFLYGGRDISNNILKDADVLLVRSITDVNKNLLEGTNVKFVGTATIGIDHVDTNYLSEKEIFFSDARGCNSDAVAEYVFTALLNLSIEQNFELKGKSIGVVGAGNIGSRIVRLAGALGMNVLQNDPPLKRQTGDKRFLDLDELMNVDIITFHVPLNMEGEDRTSHLFDHNKLNSLKDGAIIINASRGPVVDNDSLEMLISKKKFTSVLDVWENEPLINMNLLLKIRFGTPHIAGYSYEGKINGTVILYNALCTFLNKKIEWQPVIPPAINPLIRINGNSSPE
ncbi:MAG: 4-phosphoerythronate dehydrogenase, partial [Ignavibacteriaceae bacterium]|nr:4-phosphoerythronate dehydrogenase [Ignavibacteriaceae bacterium]